MTSTKVPMSEPQASTLKQSVSVRPMADADLPFVFNSWLKSFRMGKMNRDVDNTVYFTEHHKLLHRLMKRSKVLIATPENEPESICAYICYEVLHGVFVLHYAYTKQPFRSLGLMRELIKHSGHDIKTVAGCFSHMTPMWEKMYPRFSLVYQPYTLINYNETDTKQE